MRSTSAFACVSSFSLLTFCAGFAIDFPKSIKHHGLLENFQMPRIGKGPLVDRRIRSNSARRCCMCQRSQNSEIQGGQRMDSGEDLFGAVGKQAAVMAICGAMLGPFLDGYHSAFGVLQYEKPICLEIDGIRLLQTDYWVPPMFALAAVILGLSYPYLDTVFKADARTRDPSVPKVLYCISFFAFQYYLSGYLASTGTTAAALHAILAATGLACWAAFDASPAGAIMAAVTGLAGPAVEIALLNGAPAVLGHPLYHYTHPEALGIPVWIAWVYACGAPAVGNLARLFWHRR